MAQLDELTKSRMRKPMRILAIFWALIAATVLCMRTDKPVHSAGPPSQPPHPFGLNADAAEWTTLEPGLELRLFHAPTPSGFGDSIITIARVSPDLWDLRLLCASEHGNTHRTARQWANEFNLSAAINAGMYLPDDPGSHCSYMQNGAHINSARIGKQKGWVAFSPKREGIPRATISEGAPEIRKRLINDYTAIIQNERVIAAPREIVWKKDERMWCMALLGMDNEGRILFIFTRSPHAVHDFAQMLLELPIGLKCAVYLDGGPPASFYMTHGAEEMELIGSYETGFRQDDTNRIAQPLPNVIGIAPRAE